MSYFPNTQNPQENIYSILNKDYENQCCADCKNNRSTYVNLCFGTFICDQCAHIFKKSNLINGEIKSINDDFNVFELSRIKGNHEVNSEYENSLPYDFIRPYPQNQNEMANFLYNKYINKRWVRKEPVIDQNKIRQFITVLQGLSIAAIIIFVVVMLILLLIFKLFRLTEIFETTCLLMVFAVEIYSSKSSFSLFTILIEFLFGILGFKLKKALILIGFLKLTRLGFSKKMKILNILAFALVVYGFGFQQVVVASEIVLFVIIFEILFLCNVGGEIGSQIMDAINTNNHNN